MGKLDNKKVGEKVTFKNGAEAVVVQRTAKDGHKYKQYRFTKGLDSAGMADLRKIRKLQNNLGKKKRRRRRKK